MSVVIVVVVR